MALKAIGTHVRLLQATPHTRRSSHVPGAIVSLSLGSDVVMEFRQGSDHRAVLLPRRSLLVMAGESR